MTAQLEEILGIFFVTLRAAYFSADPLNAIPAFMVVTAQGSEPKRARIARQAAWTVLFVLSAFAVAGSVILKVFYQRPVRSQNLV
ncbi:MAG: hypothetical protein DMG57_24160 [Acidobacteria bacterium]|nr:MAG: hypothetical protein DMG57_24160 [Acidobacteriota bacterium]